ncbi:hypothetical protein Acsp04_49640 [Actinomadura sp. NBRC 104425]|uniref:hypothetical protein n=1 Tax=Actinomadura sp. NBRC 104425 TaxID=3032204 RepID=UPI0024A42972|nr:hypothetical protein [Actinomadura sp. NBRC 104425]GLZ14729.1 hypothetical protein Acsp04_49640 [Actinomadura sp. NBRC 104425]
MTAGWNADQALAVLRARFPEAQVWRGEHTGKLWGLVQDASGRAHLVEAHDPVELGRCLEAARAGWPAVPRPVIAAPRPADVRTPDVRAPVYGRHEAPRPPWWRRLAGAFVQLDDERW